MAFVPPAIDVDASSVPQRLIARVYSALVEDRHHLCLEALHSAKRATQELITSHLLPVTDKDLYLLLAFLAYMKTDHGKPMQSCTLQKTGS